MLMRTILFPVRFLVTRPELRAPPPHHIFLCLQLRTMFKVVVVPSWRVAQFAWASPMYTGGMHVIKILGPPLTPLSVLFQGHLSQERRRVEQR